MGLVETQKNDAVEKVLAVLRFFALAGVFIFLLNYIATLMNFRHLFGFKITDGFRRSTNYLFLCLGIFIVSRKDPYNYLLKAADEAQIFFPGNGVGNAPDVLGRDLHRFYGFQAGRVGPGGI